MNRTHVCPAVRITLVIENVPLRRLTNLLKPTNILARTMFNHKNIIHLQDKALSLFQHITNVYITLTQTSSAFIKADI